MLLQPVPAAFTEIISIANNGCEGATKIVRDGVDEGIQLSVGLFKFLLGTHAFRDFILDFGQSVLQFPDQPVFFLFSLFA